jgi:hypothetical protein
MFICSQPEGNAPGYDAPIPETKPRPESNVREHILSMWSIAQFAKSFPSYFRQLRSLELLVSYGTTVWSRKRKVRVDVPKMVENWKSVIVTLCTAHDKAEIDKAEYQMDDLLTPMLTAPVAQLREFYAELSETLKADKRVPFFIWSMFDAYGKAIIEPAPDTTKIQRLRRKIAGEIAEMAEPYIIPDISKAVMGALMWRDPETLKEIKGDLEAGAKPRLRGKESCLFLVTKARGGREHQVML